MISTDISSTVSELMSTNLIMVSPDDPIRQVINIFREHNFHHIPVVEDDLILGMISKIDLLNFFEEISRWVDARHQTRYMLENTMASELMTKEVVTVKPTDSIQYAMTIFRENYFRALPVVNEKGFLVGIVTTYDVLCHAFKPDFLKEQ